MILAPGSIIKEAAFSPGLTDTPLITEPASIVNVAPDFTYTKPFMKFLSAALIVRSAVIFPSNITSLEDGASLETVTVQVAVLPPSFVVTVIVAEPSATAVTLPASTVATFSSEVLHVTVLSVASLGVIVADKVVDSPTLIVAVVGLTATADTATEPSGLSSSSLHDTVPNITAIVNTEAKPFKRNLFIIKTFCL